MKFPLRIRRYAESYIVSDANDVSIFTIYFDDQPGVRREVRKRLPMEEAEALAKRIARWLTDEHEKEIAIQQRRDELTDPRSGEYRFNIGEKP
jgi:hypothetical protein